MPRSSRITLTVNTEGENTGRITLKTNEGKKLTLAGWCKVEWPKIKNNSTNAQIRIVIKVGFTNWTSGDNDEYTLKTIQIGRNSTLQAGSEEIAKTFTGKPGRDMYGRVYVEAPNVADVKGKIFYMTADYTLTSHPTVSVGSVATAAQIAALNTYHSSSSTVVNKVNGATQYSVISSRGANSGITPASGTTIQASWYNGA